MEQNKTVETNGLDEELLKYGLPTDIWFHVEYVFHSLSNLPPSSSLTSSPSNILSNL